MERLVERDCHNTSDSKSSRAELRRTGLSINLNLPLPVIVNGGDCQHFSIRQYIAEKEKKDMKICPAFGSSSNLLEQFPSLDVSEHKSRRCTNYTRNIGVNRSSIDKIGDAFVNADSTNFVSKDGDRVGETSNIATEVILSKKCSNREIETNCLVDAPMDKGIKTSQNKRNVFQETGCGFEMDNWDGKSGKRSKAFNQNKKVVRISMENAVTNSSPRDNGHDREQCCLLSGRKSVKSKHTSKRGSEVSRKKHNQQTQVVNGCPLQIPLKGQNSDLGTNRSGDNILIQASHASPSIEKFECHLRNDNSSLHSKKSDSDLSKLLKDTHTSSHLNMVQNKNLQRGSLSKGEDVVTSQSESELYLEEKLAQTLKNFKSAQQYVENNTIQKKNIPYCPLTILKGNKSYDPLKENWVESSQALKKGVIPIERQSIVVQSDQSSRNGFINLNRTIDLNNRKEFHISPNLLQQKSQQIQKFMETPWPNNKINIHEIQDHSYVTIPQSNQQLMKVTERGPSTDVPSMDNVEMFRNRHEKSNFQIQNGILPWINPVSTNFHPIYANAGFLRGSTAMTQVKEQPIKLSNSMQVASVSTGWELQNVKRSNPTQLSIAQNTTFQPYNLQNNQNHENHKSGQVSLGSLQKGKTISDLKSVNLIRGEDMRTKGMRSLNSFSSDGMPTTQLSRYQERPFTSYYIHPSFLMHENSDNYSGLLLPHHQLKESSGVYMGDFTEVQSSQQHVSYFKGQDVSLKSQERKRKAYAPEQFGERKLQQSPSSSGLLHTIRDSGPKVDLIRNDNIFKTLDVGGYSTNTTVLPVINIPKKDPPCLFNQNPTDIVDVDDERYLRTAEDQRIRNKSSLREKSRVNIKLDGRQRQRRKERPGRMPVVIGLKSLFF